MAGIVKSQCSGKSLHDCDWVLKWGLTRVLSSEIAELALESLRVTWWSWLCSCWENCQLVELLSHDRPLLPGWRCEGGVRHIGIIIRQEGASLYSSPPSFFISFESPLLAKPNRGPNLYPNLNPNPSSNPNPNPNWQSRNGVCRVPVPAPQHREQKGGFGAETW